MELELPDVMPTPVTSWEISSESGRKILVEAKIYADLQAPFDFTRRGGNFASPADSLPWGGSPAPPAASSPWGGSPAPPAASSPWGRSPAPPARALPHSSRADASIAFEVRRSGMGYLVALVAVGAIALGWLIKSKALLQWLLIALVCIGGVALILVLYSGARKLRRRNVAPQPMPLVATPAEQLGGRVFVGMKERSLPPSSDELDKATQAWLQSRPGERFHLVRVICTFEPFRDEVIEAAEVKLALTTNLQGVDAASIWSLTPQSVALGASSKRTASLGADLKFVNASVSKEEDRSARVTVRGMGELQRRARWILDGADETGLFGDQEFQIIVACPKLAVVKCQLAVQFQLNWSSRRRTYVAELPDEIQTLELAQS